ncbi:hypothetical protein PYCCODRAFT_1434290 [Trametes coccinea BRFM310]|uniref:GST N-terminal domain-containing protein n=1 Tax=Trametes coccinea (strain BRFM310) TaxID=1353009 RepID=A0A1Y2IQI0_TRAC3|nr:hypothetical protein PYCCODRAFT_1434290 [Trametes coccinea BRFM310]
MAETTHIPKASLYYFHGSVWASVPLLALEEKGYGPDEVDLKEVDLAKGENFMPSYLRLNPQGTVPTLVVPLEKTLAPEIESRYKAIQDTKAIVEFLDKSRSVQSRTHTTSTAPAPSLAPATIAFSTLSNQIIELLHSPTADPNALFYMNARSEEELRGLAEKLLPFLRGRRDTLAKLLQDSESGAVQVSEKTRAFWHVKQLAADKFIQVFEEASKSASELSDEAKHRREEFLQSARAAWGGLKDVLLTLHKEVIGPYTLGDQLSIADLHLAAWLSRIAFLAGANASEDGNTVLGKIEAHVGDGFGLPKDFSVAEARRRAGLAATNVDSTERQNKLAAFWDAIKERPSWKKVYASGLH